MLAIVGASGKLGFATLTALLDHNLIPADQIVCTTSSTPIPSNLSSVAGIQIRTAHWDDSKSFETAFQGCDALFLISSSRIQKDFGDAPPGQGREADHFTALEAAKNSGCVKHVYYTSLAFANPSKSRVMKAHERTEEWLANNWTAEHGLSYTILREGLYNESWPLYLGHYKFPHDEGRTEIPVAGSSRVSWTAIPDLGLASAMILAAASEDWAGKTVYLSQANAWTLQEVAEMVAKARGTHVKVRIVERSEHERYYTEERGMEEGYVKWWARTYDALRDGECEIHDPTLEDLLAKRGLKPKSMLETVTEMFSKAA